MSRMMILLLGIVLCVLGAVNFTGNISTIHSYNRLHVREEDVPKYGKIMGTGTMIIGVGMLAGEGVEAAGSPFPSEFVMIPALIIGVGLMMYGQFRYNGGLF